MYVTFGSRVSYQISNQIGIGAFSAFNFDPDSDFEIAF